MLRRVRSFESTYAVRRIIGRKPGAGEDGWSTMRCRATAQTRAMLLESAASLKTNMYDFGRRRTAEDW